MGDEHLTVNIVLKDYQIESDIGSWRLARQLIEGYDLDSETQQKLIGPENDTYVNFLQQRIVQENGGREQYSQGETVQVPRSKWQTLLIVALIPEKPIQDGSNPPPDEPNAAPKILQVQSRTQPHKPRVTPWRLTNKEVFGENQNRNSSQIQAIVVHQTNSSTARSAWNTFQNGSGSTQYLVEKDGTIYQLLPEEYSGYHVLRGSETTWVKNLNSIGIEFVGIANIDRVNGKKWDDYYVYEDLTAAQQNSARDLLQYLMRKYNITRNNIFRHPEVQAKNETEAQSVQIP